MAAGLATLKSNASATRSVMLKARHTAKASSICGRETPSASTAPISSGSILWARVSLPSMRSVARSGSSIGAVLHLGEGGDNLLVIAVPQARGGRVRGDAELRFVYLRDERRHQLAIADRPGRGSAHSLVAEITTAVEVGAVERQLDSVDHRLARNQPNKSQQSLRAKAVTSIKDFQPHRRPSLSPVALATEASALVYWRFAWPMAAHTTISKIWSSVRPAARTAAMSSSVTL